MDQNADRRSTKLESHPSAGPGRCRRDTASRSLLLALVLAGAQAGCDGERSPTSPLVPEEVERQLRVEGPFAALLISPTEPSLEYPRAGELLLDGSTVWSGAIGEPYSGYYYSTPVNVVVGRRELISPGPHTLSFRVLDQKKSPTEYQFSGYVDVYYFYEVNGRRLAIGQAARTVLRWQDVPVRLRTGAEWSIDFVVPDSIPPG